MPIDQGKLMKQVEPGVQHVILCSRESDGAVGIFYSRDPVRFLIAINAHVPLEDTEILAAEEAVQIAVALRQAFKPAAIADPVWFLTDFPSALEQLERVVRTRKRAELTPGRKVYVVGHGQGVVASYHKSGRVVVRLCTSPLVSHVVLASLESIEPLPAESLVQGEA